MRLDAVNTDFCFSVAQGLYRPLTPMGLSGFEVIYFGLATLAGRRNFLTILPVARYGHCNFEAAQVLGAFGLLVQQANGTAVSGLARFASSVPASMK
jgi:hypothetical protein